MQFDWLDFKALLLKVNNMWFKVYSNYYLWMVLYKIRGFNADEKSKRATATGSYLKTNKSVFL